MKPTTPLLLVVPLLLAACGHVPAVQPKASVASTMAARAADGPLAVVRIQGMAAQGLKNADAAANWDDRYAATNHALLTINDVQLDDHTMHDFVARLGIVAAAGYGYIGMRPPAEDRYKIQAVVLQYLQGATTEASLYKGTSIFTMAAGMVSATSGYDQGMRVGISILSAIRDNYKDANISRSARDTLSKAQQAADTPTSYQIMLDGLKQMGQAAAR